jgi:fused signal recognition particle receptor
VFSLFSRKKKHASNHNDKGKASTDIKQSLVKTSKLFQQVKTLFRRGEPLTDTAILTLRKTLTKADVSRQAIDYVINKLNTTYQNPETTPLEAVLKKILVDLLETPKQGTKTQSVPETIMVVGINGAGKTTTLAKLAHKRKQQGQSVLMAAADTFRAAATEQLQHWGEQQDITVVTGKDGSDSAAVLYEAHQKAQNEKIDLLLADTAGRLHTKQNLMNELSKCIKVLNKRDPNAPHQLLLVVDGTCGQNGISQARQFLECGDITGVVITKLDGTAKGGIAFTLTHDFNLPIIAITTGESVEDLQPFDAATFVEGILQDLPPES